MTERFVRYTCDVCGEKWDVSQQDCLKSKDNMWDRYIIFNGKYFNLCPECNKKLDDWINGNKEEVTVKIISTRYIVGEYMESAPIKYIHQFNTFNDFDCAKQYIVVKMAVDNLRLDIFREDTIQESGKNSGRIYLGYSIFDCKQDKFVEIEVNK